MQFAAIGLGGRGLSQLGELMRVPGVEICAVCDIYPDRAEQGACDVLKKSGRRPEVYTDYRTLLAQSAANAVLCCTTWITHAEIAVAAMRAGKHVAIEVGGAASLEECWRLVRVSEDTGKFCMLLENCCYDRNEMALFQMARQGLFGEVVHCEGGYRHDLRNEITYGKENRHGRLVNFIGRNGDLYPTHQLGPIAKLLRINRGNRFLSVVSVASKARGLHDYVLRDRPEGHPLHTQVFNAGDVTDTIITCANGETIRLTHDCNLPRPYGRDYALQGTRGIFKEAPLGAAIHIEGMYGVGEKWEKFSDVRPTHEHPLWRLYKEGGIHAEGHGGMDFLVLSAFAEAAMADAPPPVDVYDTAAWMSITCLSEASASLGGAPMPVPDFTDGRWVDRAPERPSIYALDEISVDLFK
jgi:hypothetical protein